MKAAKKDWKNRDAGKKRIVVAGLVTELRELITKKGTRMAFAKIEDLTGACELIIFPDSYAKFEQQLKDERPVLVGGSLEVEEGVAKVFLDNLTLLEDMLKKTKSMVLRLDKIEPEYYPIVKELMTQHPGAAQVVFECDIDELGRRVILDTPERYTVSVTNDFFEGLHALVGHTDFVELRS